ncbi:MAG: hypothetical protein K2Y39_20475 [Candidatus Obscuribacterales bacterium]|nr:hypothetical protein [Candidatus Obscuribacterales bacterium]
MNSSNDSKGLLSPACELFFLSLTSLYLELFVIRWMGGDIEAFSIFKTFPLVTCYVGLGVGCALGNTKHFRLLPVALVVMAFMMKVPDLMDKWEAFAFPTTSGFSDWGSATIGAQLVWLQLALFAPLIILLLCGPFAVMAALGARLGQMFDSLNTLKAYSINIAGAIAGSLMFALFSFLGLPPWAMLIPALVILLPYLLRGDKKAKLACLLLPVAVGCAAFAPAHNFEGATICYPQDKKYDIPKVKTWTFWSPYQRLDVVNQRFVYSESGKVIEAPLGVNIFSNRRGYQNAMDFSPERYSEYKIPALHAFLNEFRKRYQFPFQLANPGDCLVVGAGSGTDVKEALTAGASHVDAVDIDPRIIQIGREFNPGQPYSSDKVTTICDDARHYFNHCKKKYDMVLFSHLDSISSIGQGGSVRVDNYVYTTESFRQAMQLLKPEGVMVISFCTKKDWFKDRIFATLKEAAGYTPLMVNDLRSNWLIPNTFFAVGKKVQEKTLDLPSLDVKAFSIVKNYEPVNVRVLTDDWPYLYVTPEKVDLPYLTVVLEVILISLFAGRKVVFGRSSKRDWQLFFMGAAFLLLELQSISRLSLLYGSTWLTSAIVINAVLLMIWFSNFFVMKKSDWLASRVSLLYAGLFITLLISWLIPVASLVSGDSGAINYLLVTTVTSLPMFMAGLIFSTCFNQSESARRSLAFNLLGAVFGALLEYLSTYIGVSGLVVVAAILYFCSWLFYVGSTAKSGQAVEVTES